MGLVDGKVAIVTGSGRGIGREEALALAREGAKVVVNDVGTARDEMTEDKTPAEKVVNEIKKIGSDAIPDYTNVADYNAIKKMIDNTIATFGGLDILVNNAGILRDRMIVNMSEEEWDAVISVHLKGTFNCTKHAAVYWREESKAGRQRDASIINTASDAGLIGNPGQTNYGAAKAGIAAFSIIAAAELGRYGVRVNCIVPQARTRMTVETPGAIGAIMSEKPEEGRLDIFGPENVAALVVYLASDEAKNITGRVFHVMGGRIDLLEGWHPIKTIRKGDTNWNAKELVSRMKELMDGVEPEDLSSKMMMFLM